MLNPAFIIKRDKGLSNLVSPQIWLCFEKKDELVIMGSFLAWAIPWSYDPTQEDKWAQRPSDEASREYVRLTCHFSFCRSWMPLWMMGSYLVYYYHYTACMSVFHVIALLGGIDDFLSSAFSPIYYSSFYWMSYLPKFSWEPPQQPVFSWGLKKGEWKYWDLSDGKQNWKQHLSHDMIHWHVQLNIHLKYSVCFIYKEKEWAVSQYFHNLSIIILFAYIIHLHAIWIVILKLCCFISMKEM